MSGSRMKTAGRFRGCVHMGCFDLETFVGLNERSRKWQCPICLKNYSLEDVVIDPFFNRIVNMMHSCGEEITEIDMKRDGSWRVKTARQVGDLGQWHHPDGSLELLSRTEIGHGSLLECNTSKLDIHNNVNGPQGLCHTFMNQQGEVECDQKNIITMSSTTTGNGQDNEEPSINQNDSEQFGIHNSNENEVISVLQSSFGRHEINAQNSNLRSAQADVIILSDSEDDDVSPVNPVRAPLNFHADHDGYSLPSPRKLIGSSPTVASGEGPCVFSGNDYGLTNSQYPFVSHVQGGPGVHLFGSVLFDERNSGSHSQPISRVLASDSSLDPVHHVMDSNEPGNSSFGHQFTSVVGDISLAVPVSYPSVPRNELPRVVSSFCYDLESLGEGANAIEGSRSNMAISHESADSLIQKTNGESGSGSDLTADGKRLDGPFSFPRHRRSARKRTSQKAFSDRASK